MTASSDVEATDASKVARPLRHRRRWLRRIGVALVALIGVLLSVYALVRFTYPL